MFSSQGWLDARMEDIAANAGVSAATAYNHFPSKQALVAHVFAPLLSTRLEQATRDIAADRPVIEALEEQVRALTEIGFGHRRLTVSFWAAVQEYTIRVAGPAARDDELDPLVQAPVAEGLRLLIAHGQRTGQLRPFPPAEDVSRLVVDLLLLRCVDIREVSPVATSELLLTVLSGMLRPQLLLDSGAGGRPFRVGVPSSGTPTDRAAATADPG
jgi:AcrR family transcriptional regulator